MVLDSSEIVPPPAYEPAAVVVLADIDRGFLRYVLGSAEGSVQTLPADTPLTSRRAW